MAVSSDLRRPYFRTIWLVRMGFLGIQFVSIASNLSGTRGCLARPTLPLSPTSGECDLLYSLEHPFPQGNAGWLDNERLLVYDGTSFYDALDLPANNLRLVDITSGEIKTLFDGSFWSVEVDIGGETVALYAASQPGYEQGTYLVSFTDPTPRVIKHEEFLAGQIVGNWNEDHGLFVTDLPCEDDAEGLQAFDASGKWYCVRLPVLPDFYPSPSGHWRVSLKGGVWLDKGGKQAILVSADEATQVIWCPDSGCFFFVANEILYHVSLPDLAVLKVDDQLKRKRVVYQWLD